MSKLVKRITAIAMATVMAVIMSVSVAAEINGDTASTIQSGNCTHSGNSREIGRTYMYSNYLWTHDPHISGASQSCEVYDDYYSVEYVCYNCGDHFYKVVSQRRHTITHS